MDIKQMFLDSKKGDVDVKLFIKTTGEYVMCPYGRSPTKKWIGMAKLDYFVTGNYKDDGVDVFVENILKCINVGINYDVLNVSKCSSKDDLVTAFLLENKKNNYNNFYVISIDLSDMNEFIEVVEWEKIKKSGDEWRGNPDTVQVISYENLTKNIFLVIQNFINK